MWQIGQCLKIVVGNSLIGLRRVFVIEGVVEKAGAYRGCGGVRVSYVLCAMATTLVQVCSFFQRYHHMKLHHMRGAKIVNDIWQGHCQASLT